MADRTLQAAEALQAEGISVELIELAWLRPLDCASIIESVGKTRRLAIVEEQVHAGGWGATVISELVRAGVSMATPKVLGLPDDVLIPYSPSLEDALVPNVESIATFLRECAD